MMKLNFILLIIYLMRYVEFLRRQSNAKVQRLRDVRICSIKTNGLNEITLSINQ